jgi:hypothetical protein
MQHGAWVKMYEKSVAESKRVEGVWRALRLGRRISVAKTRVCVLALAAGLAWSIPALAANRWTPTRATKLRRHSTLSNVWVPAPRFGMPVPIKHGKR